MKRAGKTVAAARAASKLPWCVFKTQFHNGGLVSRHRTEAAAERAARLRRGKTECACGCVCVVNVEAAGQPAPAHEGGSPYRAAR